MKLEKISVVKVVNVSCNPIWFQEWIAQLSPSQKDDMFEGLTPQQWRNRSYQATIAEVKLEPNLTVFFAGLSLPEIATKIRNLHNSRRGNTCFKELLNSSTSPVRVSVAQNGDFVVHHYNGCERRTGRGPTFEEAIQDVEQKIRGSGA